MTALDGDFMRLSQQLFDRTPGEALYEIARQKYATPKHIAKAWSIDRATVENMARGHLSFSTFLKAMAAEKAADPSGGWELAKAVITELLGETYEEYEERKLQLIIEKAENARENLVRLRARRAALDERTGELVRTWDRRGA